MLKHSLRLAVVAALCSACYRSSSLGPEAMRGIVKTTGTARTPEVTLERTTSGSVVVRASAEDAAALGRVSGTTVAVRGEFAGTDTIVLSSFQVVEADGRPVVDGTLRLDDGRLTLCPASARCMSLGNPPASLRELLGARVWIAGSLDTGPNQFGVIKPAE